ncbi:unnamed protein product, partial [Mesorhabditis spiculigera]
MKIDLNMGNKKPEVPTEEVPPVVPEKECPKNEEAVVKDFAEFCRARNDEEADTGLIDWRMIAKVSHAQFLMAMICSTCLLVSLSHTGFSFLRFTSSAWATYILCTAYVGLRAARLRHYAHLVAYTGMVSFQTVIYMSSLCWLVYSLYAIDYQYTYAGYNHTQNLTLLLAVLEVSTLMGTVFTGVFGMMTCCRGLGRMMEEMDRVIMGNRLAQAPQITIRPIV